MCDICNSLFGHSSSCPERSERGGIHCVWCEERLGAGDTVVTFPNGCNACRSCVESMELYELFDLFDVDSVFELIEKYGLCEIEKLGRLS